MTDQKKPETMEDADLDDVQGAGIAVGNPGKRDKRYDEATIELKKEEDKKLLGDDLGVI